MQQYIEQFLEENDRNKTRVSRSSDQLTNQR